MSMGKTVLIFDLCKPFPNEFMGSGTHYGSKWIKRQIHFVNLDYSNIKKKQDYPGYVSMGMQFQESDPPHGWGIWFQTLKMLISLKRKQ